MSYLQVLAVNAAKDATELVAKLRAYHHTAQTRMDKKHLSRYSSSFHNERCKHRNENLFVDKLLKFIKYTSN